MIIYIISKTNIEFYIGFITLKMNLAIYFVYFNFHNIIQIYLMKHFKKYILILNINLINFQ